MGIFGVSLAVVGTILGFDSMRERLNIGGNIALQGYLSSLLMIGLLVATVVVGPLIDRFGNKVVLATSSFIAAGALLGFAFAHSYPVAVIAAVALGFGGGGLNTSTNALVSDLYEDNRGSMLNALGIFFGVGGMGMPLVAAAISAHIPETLVAAAVLTAVVGITFSSLSFPPAKDAHSFSIAGALRVAAYPGVLLIAFLLFFESGNEQSMNTFTSRWAGDAGASQSLAALVLALYQSAMMLGRIIAAPLLKVVTKNRMIVSSAFLSVLGTLILFKSHSVAGIAIGAFVTGLGFSPIYPTVLAIAGDRYQKFVGTAFGLIFTIALMGGVVFPFSVGKVSSPPNGIHAGTIVPLVGAIMVTVFSILLVRSNRGVIDSSVKRAEETVASR
jgi:MFS family permease